MSISSALNNAVSGLRANGRLADITSNNLANALTPGYARKVGVLQAQILDGGGAGVNVSSTARLYARDLTNARRGADGELAFSSARSDALAALARLSGEPGDADGLFARYQTFESSLRKLADTPESPAGQADAARAAGSLAATFNTIAEGVRTARQSAENEIGRLVGTLNANLEEIAKLNTDIRALGAGGRDTTALEDRREYLIDEVASILPVRTRPFDDGTVAIMTREGVELANTTAQEVSFSGRPLITPDMEYAGGTGALSGLTIGVTDVTPGGPGTQAVEGGALAGLFEVRDGIAPEFQAQIDALAADLIARFETAGLDPTLAPGDPGLFTDAGGVLDPTDIVGLSGRIALNAAIDEAAGGDPARMRDGLGATAPGPSASAALPAAMLDVLAEARDSAAVPGLSGFRSAADAVSAFGELRDSARVAAEATSAARAAGREMLANTEAETIGVDTDIEMQQLLVIEQAYAANAQVVRTISAMLDELRNMT